VGDRGSGSPSARSGTSFPELNDLLSEFVGRLRSTLDTNLVGVYLTGSFALGGGDGASDCDFLVVTVGGLDGAQEHALRRLHEEIPAWPGYWAYNFEGSYARKADLETLAALGRPWLYVNRGKREMHWSDHCNTEDVRWVLRERPLVLEGADPRTFVCEVPTISLQKKMRPQLENFLRDLLTWTTFEISWSQRYAVEATSRMLYTLEHGEVISKQDALDWATEAMPGEWRDLIDQVRQDRFLRWDDPPRPGSVERTLAFVEYVQQRARPGYNIAPSRDIPEQWPRSGSRHLTIYVALKDDGVDVWRPVTALSEGGSIYRISDEAMPADEVWEFTPGSRVRCEMRDLSEGPALVTVAGA
jgi:hypothetical protein